MWRLEGGGGYEKASGCYYSLTIGWPAAEVFTVRTGGDGLFEDTCC